MVKKQEETAVHDLRDRPVPPVKGCITDREDLRPRPERKMNCGLTGTDLT